MNITVFGGSNASAFDYPQAEYLGRLLGLAGHTVITGGYSGTMEAVSKGAAEAGAHVIGVTCDQLESWRPTQANQWVKEEKRTIDLRERLSVLIDSCEAAIAMPGGPGTLTEIALTWNLLLTESIPARPLIIVGPGWKELFSQFFQTFDRFIPESQRQWLIFAADPDEALKELKQFKK
jgi:uncharacterized protein (TIGR00730 family)